MAAESDSPRKPKLAVIGTGIAGLTSAYFAKDKYDVTDKIVVLMKQEN